ncbi:TIGR03084 family metal-binding protein [Microvirga sp. TS319]|uniref:TIGR03084 family metal-binding protein n=1 Tax=Microvirga sp. TS319 TaxID=3241165 RepID=UPI00351A195C
MLEQIVDFRDEASALAGLLARLNEGDWERVTQFKEWTINDVILHLYASDWMAAASARSAHAYEEIRGDVRRRRESGLSMIEETRLRFPDLRGAGLFERWKEQVEDLCRLLAAKDPTERLTWSGPGMAVRMFVTARQMETWAHGQEIYDAMGIERVAHDRIRNIAVIGVKTFGWSFSNRGLPVPEQPPRVELTAPSGALWVWNEDASADVVCGTAVEFCQVVTQVRNVRDTNLSVQGEAAAQWMRIAQCFAGPPADPPAPGSRYTAT